MTFAVRIRLRCECQSGEQLIVRVPDRSLADAMGRANQSGCYVHSVEPVRAGLEQVFLELIAT